MFVTGDIHMSFANELTTKRRSGRPPPREFVVTSVTSDNFDDFMHVAPDTLSVVAGGLLRAANPHMKWTELDQHGFGVLEVTRDRCKMDWWFVNDRQKADSGAYLAKSYSVGSGVARLREESAVSARGKATVPSAV